MVLGVDHSASWSFYGNNELWYLIGTQAPLLDVACKLHRS
jgi:hypothetical protein